MQRRTHESPMDFEWQTGPPMSATSPFTKLVQKQGGHQSNFSFATPSKAPPPSSNTQSTSFTSGTSATPFRNPSFTTPRRPFDAELFSETSDADSSPAIQADTEDTPENPRTSKQMTPFTGRHDKKPIFGKFGLNFQGNSPGRGDIRRPKYSDVALHKARKRKRLDREYQVQHNRRGSSDSDSDSTNHHTGKSGQRSSSRQDLPQEGWLASILTYIDSKPQLPLTLVTWAQGLMNSFFGAFAMYLTWCFYQTIRSDVNQATAVATAAVVLEMAQCSKDYFNNKCTPGQRLPALEAHCQAWEACMNKDAGAVGRARVSAQTFASIIDGFMDHLSFRTMGFLLIIFLACIGTSNYAFSSFRSKLSHNSAPPATHNYFAPIPSHEIQWGQVQSSPSKTSDEDHQMYLGNNEAGMGTPFYSHQAIMPSGVVERRGSPRKGGW